MSLIFITKFIVAIFIVVLLSVISEKVSPRIAGIIAGCPIAAAISLFFIGLEINPNFASKSAIYNLMGMISMQTFIYCYYLVSTKLSYSNKKDCSPNYQNILFSSVAAILGYFLVSYCIQFIYPNIIIAVFLVTPVTIFYMLLFKRIPNTKIENRIQLKFSILTVRAILAALIVILVTELAKYVGPNWAGLLSSFPATLFPLILIIHYSYESKHVHTIIKNVPIGIFSIIVYVLIVHLTYPISGVYWGTVYSFLAVFLYLGILRLLASNLDKKKNKYG